MEPVKRGESLSTDHPPSLDLHVIVCKQAFTLDASLTINQPGITVVWGVSGSGKSSLLRAIAGLDTPSEGHVAVAENVWMDTSRSFHLPPHKRRSGYVFQEPELFMHLSVIDNLRYGYSRARIAQRRFTVNDIVHDLGIGHLCKRKPSTLSGGERQRVALGRALLSEPELLLLDEPVAALDAGSRGCILEFLVALKKKHELPMIYVTHHIDEVARLADTVCIMHEGTIVSCGPKVVMMQKIYRRNAPVSHAPTHQFHEGNDCPYDLIFD